MRFPRDVFIQRDSEKIERDYPFYFYAIYKAYALAPGHQ